MEVDLDYFVASSIVFLKFLLLDEIILFYNYLPYILLDLHPNIQNLFFNLFNYNLPFVYYQDITNCINNKIFINNIVNDIFYINLENNNIYDINLYKYLSKIFSTKNADITKKIEKHLHKN